MPTIEALKIALLNMPLLFWAVLALTIFGIGLVIAMAYRMDRPEDSISRHTFNAYQGKHNGWRL